jgi:chitinase
VKLQQNAAAAGRPLTVGFTLPATTGGLDANGLQTVSDAISHGVKLAYVNLTTRNFGRAGDMGAYTTQAGEALMKQLASLYPSVSGAQVARMVGITPMLGINDQAFETFGLADAATVQAWASQNHIGLVGAWSLNRDVQCAHPVAVAQPDCSGVTQDPYAFAKTLGAFTG